MTLVVEIIAVMRLGCVALLLCLAGAVHGQQLRLIIGSQPRVQRFMFDEYDEATYHAAFTPSVGELSSWLDRHLSLVDGLMSAMFGVYPCPYQVMAPYPNDFLSSARQMFLEQLESAAYSDTPYVEYAGDAEGLLRPLTADNTDFQGGSVSEPQFVSNLRRAEAMYPLTAGSLPNANAGEPMHPAERELVAWLNGEGDEEVVDGRLFGGAGAVGSAAMYLPLQETQQLEAMEVEEEASATWGFVLFMVLTAACVAVWALLFTTCCRISHSCAASRQNMAGEESLLEPLCQNDYGEPARVVNAREFANPAFMR